MARPLQGSELTVAQLEKLLAHRKADLDALTRDRAKLQKQIDAIDEKIARLGGSAGHSASGRAKNSMSLIDALAEALKNASAPMGVGDIVAAVKGLGYKSTSANFRGLVNQTLLKERKQFTNTARGMYQLKK